MKREPNKPNTHFVDGGNEAGATHRRSALPGKRSSALAPALQRFGLDRQLVEPQDGGQLEGVRLFFVGGPISLSGGGEAGGNWIRQGVVRSGGGSGGRRYFCRQRPMGDFRWSSRAS